MPQYGMKMMEKSSRASQKLKLNAGDGGCIAGFRRIGSPGPENILRSMFVVWAGLPCDSEPPKLTSSHQARLLNICCVFIPIMISYLRRLEGGKRPRHLTMSMGRCR